MSLTEIIFWVFCRLRSLFWYQERLGWMLQAALSALSQPDAWLCLETYPQRCAFAEKLVGAAAHVHPFAYDDRPRTRILCAPSMDRLVLRLARLRAAKICRERDGACPLGIRPPGRHGCSGLCGCGGGCGCGGFRKAAGAYTKRIRAPHALAPRSEKSYTPQPADALGYTATARLLASDLRNLVQLPPVPIAPPRKEAYPPPMTTRARILRAKWKALKASAGAS